MAIAKPAPKKSKAPKRVKAKVNPLDPKPKKTAAKKPTKKNAMTGGKGMKKKNA